MDEHTAKTDDHTAMDSGELPQLHELFRLIHDNGIEPTELTSMVVQAYEEHKRTGNLDLINSAVVIAATLVEYSHAESASLSYLHSIYGIMLETRYIRTGDMADLEAAIQAAQQAVDLTSDDHPDQAGYLSNLGSHLESRYERTGAMADLEAAIQAAQQAVNLTPDDHPDRAGMLSNLGNKLQSRYERTGAMADLETAIQAAQQAVDLNLDDYLDRAGYLNNLGNKLQSRYERTGAIADLEAAIQAAQQAVNLTPDNHLDRAGMLNNLGSYLESRYERTGAIIDLEAAIQAAQQAVDLTPGDHPGRAEYLSNLGNTLQSRYEQTGAMADLEAAIQAAQRAVDSTPDDHPDRAGRLNNLGNKLGSRYERTGAMTDLEAAIQAAQQAVDLTLDDHLDRAGRLSNLGSHLESRYERTGAMIDLKAAIQAAQQAVDLTPDDHPDRAGRLNNLGNTLQSRYERTGAMADLEAAIQAAQRAVNSTPDNHLDWAVCLNNLGNTLQSRYERTGAIADLEAAIQAAQRAVDLTPDDYPDRAGRLNNLGNKLESRYKRTNAMTDLEAAIQAAQQAVDLTPDDHLGRAVYLSNLGNKLESRYERTGNIADLEMTSDSFLSAWKCEASISFYRVRAAARCVNILGLQGKLDPAAALAIDAINLLPTVSNRSLQRSDQQYAVSYFSGLAALACSVYLRLGSPEQALEILERGRTVILSQMIGDRSDISTLSEARPEIADHFEKLLEEINAPLPGPEDPLTMKYAQQRRQDCVAAFELCIQDIRGIPGYDRFLLGLTPAEMCACATVGPIVVVNVTTIGSHAIVVTSSEIKSMELPTLSASDAQRWLNLQWNTDRQGLESSNKELREYLDWLWQVCVRGVLLACGFRVQQVKHGLPRIWWIGTGLASSMPFHAAGDHRPRSDRNLFKRVISSYTPSIKALAHSREQLRKSNVCGDSILLATMSTTPGLPTLGGVEDEKEAILKALHNQLKSDVHDHPSACRIVQSLEHCSIAHFACHGLTNYMDPSKSGLIFQKQDNAGCLIQDTVTVQIVSELKLEHARLAYLSACSTAENGAVWLRDEVIHIVSGFQVAGFAHVVGCQWPSADAVCVEVARTFYGTLFGRDRKMEDEDIALALHRAVSAVREKEWDQPLRWAQFVHYGA